MHRLPNIRSLLRGSPSRSGKGHKALNESTCRGAFPRGEAGKRGLVIRVVIRVGITTSWRGVYGGSKTGQWLVVSTVLPMAHYGALEGVGVVGCISMLHVRFKKS